MKRSLFLTMLIAVGPLNAAIKNIMLNVEPKAMIKHSPDGTETPVVFVNEPFRVTVTVEGNKDASQKVIINGINQFTLKSHSQSNNVSIINGTLSSKITHEYELISNEIGRFNLGPAELSANKKKLSNEVEVTVIKKPANFKPQSTQNAGVDVQVEFKTLKEKLVVGEPALVTLVVKSHGPVLNIAAEPAEFPGFITKLLQNEEQAQETIDNKEYQVIKRHYLVIPMQTGDRTLGPINVVYTHRVARPRPQHRTSSFFGNLFDDFAGHRVEQQSASSNEIPIEISPIPVTKKPYSGIGSFEEFSIKIDKNKAQEHEPIMVFAEIKGVGNLDQLSSPQLTLPNGWKAYESKQNIDEESITSQGQKGRKFFEFVLQVPQSGSWELPPQTFHFYDPIAKQFKMLQSAPISLTITPDRQEASIKPTSLSTNTITSPESPEPENISNDIHFINDEEITSTQQSAALSWWVFFLLIIAPTLLLSQSFLEKLRAYFTTDQDRINEHCKKIEAAIKQENASALYDLFKGLLAEKFNQPIYAMTHDMIGSQLLNNGMKHDKVEEFLEFLNECARFHFIQETRNSFEQKSIIKKGTYWIVFLTQTSKEQS